jgi:hypothetical protein
MVPSNPEEGRISIRVRKEGGTIPTLNLVIMLEG